MMALKPGRDTFGAEFVLGVSGRCAPVFVEEVAAGVCCRGLIAEVVALDLLGPLLMALLPGSICCARARKSASEASSK